METLRLCANIRSRKHPDVSCPSVATHGDFCSRHVKNPLRFHTRQAASFSRISTRKDTQAVRRIQSYWRRWSAIFRYKRQGPAANCFDIAQNETELYSLEKIQSIPLVFFFSFADSTKCIWAFDIRSLSHILTQSPQDAINPYTREILSLEILGKLHERIAWLRQRRYPVFYATGENLTASQIWSQKVLEIFLNLESLGYRASCRWFEDLDEENHTIFYRKMYLLWTHYLELTPEEKNLIVPGYLSRNAQLFKWIPGDPVQETWNLQTWRKHNLNLISNFIRRASDKNQRALGALYVIMGFTYVHDEASEAYPWIVETLENYL
jgi:hypothetical protein